LLLQLQLLLLLPVLLLSSRRDLQLQLQFQFCTKASSRPKSRSLIARRSGETPAFVLPSESTDIKKTCQAQPQPIPSQINNIGLAYELPPTR
jgi:hypothetical protein